jgi:acetylornithine deacetylase/succinyl-diaminopimelate desuccinylase-like protein
MRRLPLSVLALVMTVTALDAQAPDARTVRERVRHYRQAHDHEILRELAGLLAIPNLASDSARIRENADHLRGMLERRGFTTRLLETPGSPAAVYGELTTPGARRTIVFYAHYDGQPVDSAQWASPPWTPTLVSGAREDGGREIPLPSRAGETGGEWRLYARSASDDKSPIVAFLAGLDALRAARIPLSVNVKMFLEGEEEAGSAHLRPMLEKHASLLGADLWIFGDGPVHQSRRPQIVYGVRGVMGLELTTYGPARALHSGHYGNWAPNPVARLAELLASMRDGDGRITIDGFYDDVVPPSDLERRAIDSVPPVDSALRADLLLAHTEANDAPLLERIMLPALNVRGLQGGAVGARAANAVPTMARASIDFRLVPKQTPARVRELVERHVRARGWHIVHEEPSEAVRAANARVLWMDWGDGYPATRTPLDLPVARALTRVVDEASTEPVVRVPTLGGSLPIYHFEEVLHTPVIVLPIVNHDNNQHAGNENVRLQNVWDGMEIYAAVLARLGALWR